MGHGRWELWVKKNCHFSLRTAQKYLEIAKGWDELQAKTPRTAFLTIDAALRMLKRANRQKPRPMATTNIVLANAIAKARAAEHTASASVSTKAGGDRVHNAPDPIIDDDAPAETTRSIWADIIENIELEHGVALVSNPTAYILRIMQDGQVHGSPETWDIPPAVAIKAFIFEYRNADEQERRLDYLKRAANLHWYVGRGRELIDSAFQALRWLGHIEAIDGDVVPKFRVTDQGTAAARAICQDEET